MTSGSRMERPNTVPWPPILFIGVLVAANLLTFLLPIALPFVGNAWRAPGYAIAGLSVVFMLWAFIAFRRHNTTVLPHRRSDALITTAPFSISRNPIYLAEAVLLAGLALANGSVWYLAVIPPFMLAVTRLAIVREEAHLAARFGDDWQAYAARVRRWL